MSGLPPAYCLMGPTASGKTGLAVELAQRFPLTLISVDSALVYRDMDIGTAKPDAATLARAPHHLIDIRDPDQSYSAAAFRNDAVELMQQAVAQGRIPFLVGGTMLYFKALRDGLSPLPQADAALRAELDAEIARDGIVRLHARLAAVDPETAARLSPNDTQRIQRALEVYRLSGHPLSELIRNAPDNDLPCRLVPLALLPEDRAVLHQRIAQRFDQMREQGLIEELQMLRARYPLQRDMPAMRCVGYRQAWSYLEGEIGQDALREQGIAATRQLAKRQLTWLRGMGEAQTFDCLASDLLSQLCRALEAPLPV